MTIIKRMCLAFSEDEIEAINLVCKICSDLEQETDNPELIRLAETVYNNLSELLEWEEEEE